MKEKNYISQFLDGNSAVERGKRLTLVREMAGFSMVDFANEYKIGYSTLKSWENGKGSGLSNKGARTIVVALQKEGVICDLQWLLHGKGNLPSIITKSTEINIRESITAISPIEEIKLFQNLYPNSILLTIEDNGMEPIFGMGDILGGACLNPANFKLAAGKICIVETEKWGLLCRKIQLEDETGSFNLFCINPDTTFKNPVIPSIKPSKLAPVKRVWKS